ncbi:MAG: hypothetical protein U1D55_09705 [Phycisphaerae bacterium]
MNPIARLVRKLAYAGAYALLLAAPLLAQSKKGEDRVEPFDVVGLDHTRPWIPWVFAFVFVAGCVAIALKNPHRGHLD